MEQPIINDLNRFLTNRKKIMLEQLYQFCEINSGSSNLLGLYRMGELLKASFKSLADQIDTHAFEPITSISMAGDEIVQKCGDGLLIRKRPDLKKRVLLCGHMDTVYPADSAFQKLKVINDNRINGPGVADMKGGLLIILHALAAFETLNFANKIGWDVFINADEEIGSPASAPLLEKIACHYQTALVYEPALSSSGTLAKNRCGSGKLTLVVTGKAAHVGRAFAEGRNAICYLAEILGSVHDLNGQREGVIINVGLIAGGTALNVVAEKAVAKIDVRFSSPEDEQWITSAFDNLVQRRRRKGYSLNFHANFGRPVKRINSATEKLFTRLRKLGKNLGLDIDWQDSGGCCDGNNLAHQGLAVIDTLGARGGDIHSPKEFIFFDSLRERALLSALLLADLAQETL